MSMFGNNPFSAAFQPAPDLGSSPRIFGSAPSTNIFARNNSQSDQLIDRLRKVEQQSKNLRTEQENLRKQLEICKKNPSQKEFDNLKKELSDLKSQINSRNSSSTGVVNLFRRSQAEEVDENKDNEELRNTISELKKICSKKETELDFAVAVIEKQQKTIEAQTVKISGLEIQIQTGFAKLSLQLANLNKNNPSPINNESGINQSGFSMMQRAFPKIQKPVNHGPFDNQSIPFNENILPFQKRSTNPLSQSAVFESRPLFDNNNNNNITYKEDGYLIKYRNGMNNMIHNLEISNFLGKIEVLEPIDKKFIANRRISEIVNIGSNVCQIIDHNWDNFSIKLTTFNFMNLQQMSLSERVELNKKVKHQAELTGLDYYLDGLTGNLEITTKPKSSSFKL